MSNAFHLILCHNIFKSFVTVRESNTLNSDSLRRRNLQGSKGDTDIKKRIMVMVAEGEGERT